MLENYVGVALCWLDEMHMCRTVICVYGPIFLQVCKTCHDGACLGGAPNSNRLDREMRRLAPQMGIPLSRNQKATFWWPFCLYVRRRDARPLRGVRRGFEGAGLPARPSPDRPTAAAARQPRAPAARVRGSNQLCEGVCFYDA